MVGPKLCNVVVLLLVTCVLVLGVGVVISAAGERVFLQPDLYIEEMEEGLYRVVHNFPWTANALLVKVSDTEFVLIDTPYTPEATQAVVEWLRSKHANPEIVAINTGFHIDNLGGNEFLLSEKIPVYGADLTAQLVEERSEHTRTQLLDWLTGSRNKRYHERFQSIEFWKPDHLFDIHEGLRLEIGAEVVEVYFPGFSHSPDNVVVYLQNRNVLFGGCMVKSLDSRDLGFTGDADVKEWYHAVRRVVEKYGESRIVVVPGHGDWGDVELLSWTLELLEGERLE